MKALKALWSIIKTVYVTIMTICGLAWIFTYYDDEGRKGICKMLKKKNV